MIWFCSFWKITESCIHLECLTSTYSLLNINLNKNHGAASWPLQMINNKENSFLHVQFNDNTYLLIEQLAPSCIAMHHLFFRKGSLTSQFSLSKIVVVSCCDEHWLRFKTLFLCHCLHSQSMSGNF